MAEIDPRKLNGWYTAYAPALTLFARQWTSASAEDVVQDAFVHLISQRAEPANVKAWLYKTVRNAAISQLRANRSRTEREKKIAENRAPWFMSRPEDWIDASAAQIALQSLEISEREIVVLRIWSQLNFAEIAELTHTPLSTVYDQYKAAVATLRKKMESSCKVL